MKKIVAMIPGIILFPAIMLIVVIAALTVRFTRRPEAFNKPFLWGQK